MLKLTLSTYTLNDERVWQVMVGGSPLCREQDNEARAREVLDAAVARHHGRLEVWAWNGDTCEETLVYSGVGGGGSERYAA